MKIEDRHLVAGIVTFISIAAFITIGGTYAAPTLYARTDYVEHVETWVSVGTGYTEYKVCNPAQTSFLIDTKSRDTFDWEFDVAKGELTDSWFMIKRTTTREMTYENVSCVDTGETDVFGEVIYEKCTSNPYTKYRGHEYWERWTPVGKTLDAGTCHNIRLYGIFPLAYDQPIKIDNIISVAGYKFEEYAWWDVAYGFRHSIGFNNTTYSFPISVNDTDGINGSTYWSPANRSATEELFVYCKASGCASNDIAIANETAEVFWERENSTDGNSPTSVWSAVTIWHMNNASSCNDSTANNNWGAIGNSPALVTGIFGNALDFEYANEDNILMPSVTFKTVTLWFKPELDGNTNHYLLDAREGLANGYVYIGDDGSATLSIGSGWDTQHLDTLPVASGVSIDTNWHFLVLYDSGDTDDIMIGARYSDAEWFDGVIDEVNVYNRQLTLGEIQQMYYNGMSGNLTALGSQETPSTPSEPFKMEITLTSPTNTTYTTDAIDITGTLNMTGNTSWNMNGQGNVTGNRTCVTFDNNTNTDVNEGGNNIIVYAVNVTNSTDEDSETVYFTVDTNPPDISIVDPTGTHVHNTTIALNYGITDAVSPVANCSYNINDGSNVSLNTCANTTINLTLTGGVGTAGDWTVYVYGNDTNSWQTVDTQVFTYDPVMNFTANSSVDGSIVTTFSMYVVETGKTYTTTNGTVSSYISDIGYGTRTLRFTSSNYNTTFYVETVNTGSLLNNTYELDPAYMNITVYDESDVALGVWSNLTFNVTMSNATNTTAWYNQVSSLFEYVTGMPTGDVTIDVSSYGYQSRRYYRTININSAYNMMAFLLPTADALYVRFHILTTAESAIEGARVTAQRFLNASWQSVGQQTSDESGTAAIYLNPLATYRINVTATGYVSREISIQPSNSDYRIYMTATGGVTTYTSAVSNLTIVYLPEDFVLNASVQSFVCEVISLDGELDYIGFNITFGNGTVEFTNTTTTADGTRINTSIDLTFENGTNLTSVCFFKKSGFISINYTRLYYIVNQTEGYLGSALKGAESQFTQMTLGLVSIIVTMVVAGWVNSISNNGVASGVVALLVLAIFTFYFTWFDWRVFTGIVVVLASATYLTRTGGV